MNLKIRNTLSFILVIMISVSYAQSDQHIVIDTSDYSFFCPNQNELFFGPQSDSAYTIYGIDTTKFGRCSGKFETFLKKDNQCIVKGRFANPDSIEVFKDGFVVKEINFYHTPIPAGLWKFFYANGQLKSSGTYSEKIRTYTNSSYPISYDSLGTWPKPVPRALVPVYLKSGTWQYYDKEGSNIKTEEFREGVLIDRIIRTK